MKRLISLALALVFVLSLSIGIFASEKDDTVTVLFTHDLHSHLLPSVSESGDE